MIGGNTCVLREDIKRVEWGRVSERKRQVVAQQTGLSAMETIVVHSICCVMMTFSANVCRKKSEAVGKVYTLEEAGTDIGLRKMQGLN